MLRSGKIMQAAACSLILLSPLSTPRRTAKASYTYPVYLVQASSAPSNEVLEERIKSIRTDLVNILKWSVGLTLGLYTILFGYNFYKSLVLEKKEKENLKDELRAFVKEEIEALLPEGIEKAKLVFQSEISELAQILDRIKVELIWSQYKLNLLEAEAASNSIYRYALALSGYAKAIQLLQDYKKLFDDDIKTPEIPELINKHLQEVYSLMDKLKKESGDLDGAPSLSEEQLYPIQNLIDAFPEGDHIRKEIFQELLNSLRPLIKPEIRMESSTKNTL